MVSASSCTTAKVKVAEPGQSLADDIARVEAVRDALGPTGQIRVDANAAWSLDEAVTALTELSRFTLEYAEQPVASLTDMAILRRRVDVKLAADESVRNAEDPLRIAGLEAADIVVLKVQPLGGVRACLAVADACGLPVVVSSAIETSVGIAAGLALAGALPELPYACGLATVALLDGDVCSDSLVAVDGTLPVSLSAPEPDLIAKVPRRRRDRRLVGAPPRRRPGRARCPLRTPARRAFSLVLVDQLASYGVRHAVVAPGSRSTPIALALIEHPQVAVHVRIDERSAAYLALGIAKASGEIVPVLCTSGTASVVLPRRGHGGRPLMHPAARAHRRPAARAPRDRRQPDRRAARTVWQRGAMGAPTSACRTPARMPSRPGVGWSREIADLCLGHRVTPAGPVHLNVPLREPLTPVDDGNRLPVRPRR